MRTLTHEQRVQAANCWRDGSSVGCERLGFLARVRREVEKSSVIKETAMEWQYVVEEVPKSKEELETALTELGSGGWEAVTSLVIQGDRHINQGASRTFILFKKPK